MKFLKELNDNAKLTTATWKSYADINLGNNFFKLLEALQFEGLCKHIRRQGNEDGYVWIDEIETNGIHLFTSHYPTLNEGNTKILKVGGSSQAVDTFNNVLNRYLNK